MVVTVNVYIPDPATDSETYNEIILLRDIIPSGSFSTQVGTAALVSTTNLYTIVDSAGGPGNVYRYYEYNTTTGAASTYSEIFYPQGMTLAALRLATAREASAGFNGTCSAAGTTTTLVDLTLTDNGIHPDYEQGNWIYRPNATSTGDRMRRIEDNGYNATTGTLTVSRAWTNAPTSGEAYQVYSFFPPIDGTGLGMSWDRIIRRALREAWFVQQINLGPGAPPIHRFSLNAYGGYFTSPDIRRVFTRYTDTLGVIHDWDCDTRGRYWQIVEAGPPDGLSIDIWPPPITTQYVMVEVERVDANLFQDTDITLCPFEYAVQAATWQLFYELNAEQPGKYTGELAAAQGRFERLLRKYRPAGVIRGV